jgi:transposase
MAQEQGFLAEGENVPSLPEIEASIGGQLVQRRTNISSLEPFRPVVLEMIKNSAEATAIHRRLRQSNGYTGSYGSVLRFLQSLRPSAPEAVVRIETAPGKQAQVDFGTVGKMLDPFRNVLRTLYCFVMTLSWSRHMFVRFVFDQRIPTWLECHRLAFNSFGGVPEEIVIDNLKAAVLNASLTDPVLSEPYRRFARHYEFLVHPCRPRTPEHKGKVESSVHYVKRNFVASEDMVDINEANRKVEIWAREEAGLRLHGTTQARPMQRFLETERAALKPIPTVSYDLELVVRATLHRDCHVQVNGSFYSAPFAFIGKIMDVYVHQHVVQIFDGVTLLTTHERANLKGQRMTRQEHYPPEKSIYMIRTRCWCESRALEIGPNCLEIVDRLLAERPLDRLRAVQGIVGLADKWPTKRVDAACARASHFGDPSYRRVKAILEAGADLEPVLEPLQMTTLSFSFARSAGDFFSEEEMSC